MKKIVSLLSINRLFINNGYTTNRKTYCQANYGKSACYILAT